MKVGNHQYSTYPEELNTKDSAEALAAKICLAEVKSKAEGVYHLLRSNLGLFFTF